MASQKITNMDEALSIDGANDYLVMVDTDDTTQSPTGTNKKIKPDNLGISGADEKTKVSANDTTAGYLNGKLVAGTNVSLVEGSDGGNETLTINNTQDISGKADKSNVLELDNTDVFTPTLDYHPSTKKYVDDAAGGGNSTLVIKTIDETKTSDTTLADDSELTATLEANSTYFIYARVVFTSGTAPDFKYTVTAPADAFYGFFEGIRSSALAFGTSRGVTVGSAAPRSHFIYCWVETVTGGSFAFQWAQNTSSAVATTVEKGSYLDIFKTL